MDDAHAGRSSNKLRAAVNRAEREACMSGVLSPKNFSCKNPPPDLLAALLSRFYLYVCHCFIFFFISPPLFLMASFKLLSRSANEKNMS